MGNNIYDAARYQLLTAGLNWLTTDIVVAGWAGVPTFIAADKKIADLIARGIQLLGVSMTVASKSVASNGTAQTDKVVLPQVPVGPPLTHFTLGRRMTPVNQSELILFIDDAENLPYNPNGLDIVIQPDWSLNRGWFRP